MSVATASGSESASEVLSRMDASIASMKECRKEFAALLSKTAKSAATKAKAAEKRAAKKEAEASGEPLAPKERTSAWQAFSAGDEVHGVSSAVEAYPDQYAAWLAEQPNAKQALTKFAKFARTADFGSEDYAALEERYAGFAAERKSTASSGSSKRKGKLSEEEKAANKAARSEETAKRRAAAKEAKDAEKAAAKAAKAAPAAATPQPATPATPGRYFPTSSCNLDEVFTSIPATFKITSPFLMPAFSPAPFSTTSAT